MGLVRVQLDVLHEFFLRLRRERARAVRPGICTPDRVSHRSSLPFCDRREGRRQLRTEQAARASEWRRLEPEVPRTADAQTRASANDRPISTACRAALGLT